MRKRILPLLFLVIIGFALLRPGSAGAAAPPDPNGDASLTLYYQKDGKAFANLQIGVFRVAEALPDGTYELIEPFASYPVNIHGITAQEQWRNTASTLRAYIVANQVAPDWEAQTDENGMVQLPDLDTGLYLVREVVTENSDGTYVFDAFMVYLPTPQPDGSYDYTVEAKPKCSNFTPKTQYTVTKLWGDGGSQNARPKEVTVDIYKDGALQETQILSAGNHWSYTWYVSSEDRGQWIVAERAVLPPYKVTVQQNGSTFSIINTCQTQPQTPQAPHTGDSFTPLPWILAMCFSGIMLLLLGLYSRRQR